MSGVQVLVQTDQATLLKPMFNIQSNVLFLNQTKMDISTAANSYKTYIAFFKKKKIAYSDMKIVVYTQERQTDIN